ncbi:MAG: hypothetical protein WD077_15095 [Bacteroidia bacterium]
MDRLILTCLLFLLTASILSLPVAHAQTEKRACKPSDIPHFLTTFNKALVADSAGNFETLKEKSVFESDDYFVYQKKRNGEFSTYLINAEEYCESTYKDGTIHSVSFSVFLWDTPIERKFTLYLNGNKNVEELKVSYPKGDISISEIIFTNR